MKTIEVRVRGEIEREQAQAIRDRLAADHPEHAVTITVESAPDRSGEGRHGYTPEHVLRQVHSGLDTSDEYTCTLDEIGLDADELAKMTATEVERWCSQVHAEWVFEQIGDNFGWSIDAPEGE